MVHRGVSLAGSRLSRLRGGIGLALALVIAACSEAEAPLELGPDASVEGEDSSPPLSPSELDAAETLAPPSEAQIDTDALEESPEVRAPEDIDASEALGEEPDACPCDPMMWCEGGVCVDDLCAQGESTCQDTSTLATCNSEGSALTLTPCSSSEVCHGGACQPQVCDPDAPPQCEGTSRVTCDSLGLSWAPLPCPEGSGCLEGQCEAIEPNVIFIVDTSTSMSLLADTPESYPDACVGAECPPWSYPDCEDPLAPMTRLARVKVALSNFITSQEAATMRLALMRFPQSGIAYPNCMRGHYAHLFHMWGDSHAPESDEGWFTSQLFQVLCEGFSPDATSNLEGIMKWLDFEESFGPTGEGCDAFWDCPWEVCEAGQCHDHSDPELRGSGPTPLGKSLFYAGEYLRHMVINEGKACTEDAACNSPHYSCVDGSCRDPFFACRETSIVLFTDGYESVYEDTDDFFNPLVQAKRLHYGLGCSSDDACLNDALCVDGRCRFEGEPAPDAPHCNAYGASCATDDECSDFPCGLDAPCEGRCQGTSVTMSEPQGVNTLKTLLGDPIPLTVHVIDASLTIGYNPLIATYGGGAYIPVDLASVETLSEALESLTKTKLGGASCGEAQPSVAP